MLVVLVGAVNLADLAFWIWMIVDCTVHEPRGASNRPAWIVLIVLTHCVGAAIYFFARRPKRKIEAVMSKAGGAPTSSIGRGAP